MNNEILEQLVAYANEDLDLAVENGTAMICQTKMGNLDVIYDAEEEDYMISYQVSPSAVFSQSYTREQAVDFVVNAYDVQFEEE
jgi:hypothetical protein